MSMRKLEWLWNLKVNDVVPFQLHFKKPCFPLPDPCVFLPDSRAKGNRDDPEDLCNFVILKQTLEQKQEKWHKIESGACACDFCYDLKIENLNSLK